MTPLHRACVALHLPRGLYCYRGRADMPLGDAEIRASLRQTPVINLAQAVAGTIRRLEQIPDDAEGASVVLEAAEEACARNALSPSMVGVVLALALTGRSDDGEITAEEWAALNEVMP